MTYDAVRYAAKTGEIGKEFFFEKRRNWIVHIRRERLLPEVPKDIRRFHGRIEKRREEPETLFYLFPDQGACLHLALIETAASLIFAIV